MLPRRNIRLKIEVSPINENIIKIIWLGSNCGVFEMLVKNIDRLEKIIKLAASDVKKLIVIMCTNFMFFFINIV